MRDPISDATPPCPHCVSEYGKADPSCPYCKGSGACPSSVDPLLALVAQWREHIRQIENEEEKQTDQNRRLYCDGKLSGFRYCANALEAVLQEKQP